MTTQHIRDLDLQYVIKGTAVHANLVSDDLKVAARAARRKAMATPAGRPSGDVGHLEHFRMAAAKIIMPYQPEAAQELFRTRRLREINVSDALFDGIERDARENGNPVPTQAVVDEAKRIARGLDQTLLDECDVYTLEEGKIAIEVFGLPGHGFLLICEPGGNALCIVTERGVSRRARYESSSSLPDGFLHEGLADARRGY